MNKIANLYIDGEAIAYELVPFTPNADYPEQQGCLLLKPVDIEVKNFSKMTKAQLIDYIAEHES